jgi:hypothetical protein
MTIAEQISELSRSVEEFASCVASLSGGWFLKPIDAWAPRDVVAHLIGWNRYTITGCEQIRNGETPFYFSDPGEDFSKINATLVQAYASQDKQEILDELAASLQELTQYLRSLDPADWERDYGVRYQGEPITIRNTVDALMGDFVHHQQQIEAWAKGADKA